MAAKLYETAPEKEKAIVIGIALYPTKQKTAQHHLDELARLGETAGAEIVKQVLQKRQQFDPKSLIGSGKLSEISGLVKALDVDLVLFDEDLSPSQAKRIEAALSVKVLDRSGIILDIFARNARTAEAKLQVEVAQLEYYLPRLTRAWTHLSRQVGGIGTRGPGETQLEVDRRLVRDRIADLKRRIRKNEGNLKRQHKHRYPAMHVGIVGYTNTGKSSLMNLLTRSTVQVEDKLFATLDATTRKLPLKNARGVVLSDTVGFIRKLPHNLVESFKTTLSVVSEASLILHVVDVSEDDFPEHMEVTAQVLAELNTDHIPRITVFNKIELLDENVLAGFRADHPRSLFISVHEKLGIEELKNKIADHFALHKEKHEYQYEKVPGKKW